VSANEGHFSNPFGHFRLEDKSFVISDVHTPRPWVNVLGNDRYGLVISQAGGGFSWFENCQLFRISRWEQDLVQDSMGRFVYVQDLDSPNDIWSTTYQPTRKDAAVDRVVHGLGSTTFEREFLELRVTHTLFVPTDSDCEIWRIEIQNLSDRPRNLRLASYQELHLGGIGDWHREFHRLFTESRVVDNSLIAWKHPNLPEGHRGEIETPIRVGSAWIGTDGLKWVTDKSEWLGRQGSLTHPAGLTKDDCGSDTPRWDDPVAVGIASLGLAPGETRSVTHVIGAGRSEEALVEGLNAWRERSVPDALKETELYWRTRCGKNPMPASDPAVNLLINGWLPYQAIVGRIYAKCAYYQQGGAYGYRDQLQDSLMFLDTEPENTLLQIKRHAEAMYEDGGVRHWWHPNSDIFVKSKHSDTCLWLAFAVLEYLDATGDTDSLSGEMSYLCGEVVPTGFASSPAMAIAPVKNGKGTLLDHCLRGIERCLALRSDRGLPLMLAGDWNDGLSHVGLEGRGESVWVAMFLFHILVRIAPVLAGLGRLSEADRYQREAQGLKVAVNTHAWDGQWYLAGTRDDGRTLGSSQDVDGSIFLNPQTWAVITGIAPPERVEAAMNAVRERLVVPYGALLLAPAFRTVDPYVGYLSRYAPGLRENGGVYSHASTWAVQAFAMIGDQETAKKLFHGMLPCVRAAEDVERYAAEPYVMPGNADGPDSPFEGRAGWTWYTGSAAWMVRIARRWLSWDQ
jgi:cellobiose phosphorylase